MNRITSATTTTVGRVYGIRVEIAAALTGTLTIADDRGTQAVLPIGATGGKEYRGFTGIVTITNSAAEEVTISALTR